MALVLLRKLTFHFSLAALTVWVWTGAGLGSSAQAAEALEGESYTFKAGETLSSVLWAKMSQRHLQENHVRLYGNKGLLKLTQKMNPTIQDPEHVPPGTRVRMPKITDRALAAGDLSPGDEQARAQVKRSLASSADTYHALEQDTAHAPIADPAPPVAAPTRAAEPMTIADPKSAVAVSPPTPIQDQPSPDADQDAEPAPRIRLVIDPPTPAPAPLFAPARPFHFVVHAPSEEESAKTESPREPASVPAQAPKAPGEEEHFSFHWGTWNITE